jgi:hypothetical protein
MAGAYLDRDLKLKGPLGVFWGVALYLPSEPRVDFEFVLLNTQL